jgi:6-phosphogluconate dehydrogenase
MRLGVIGLGRMGGNIARRLIRDGHDCVVWDTAQPAIDAVVKDGGLAATDFADLMTKLPAPRAIWLMLPAGRITEDTITRLAAVLSEGDTLIDGGNSFYKDDIRRAKTLRERGLHYLDVGTSGGVWGVDRGYCLMIGGDKTVVDRLDPIFRTLAPGPGAISRTDRPAGADPRPENGYLYAGPAGAGHFVKMIHNGIEYGLMQAYAEGFDILRGKASEALLEEERFDLNLPDIAEVWRRGSVVSSWLLDLTASALAKNPTLTDFSGEVADSGEGRWTVDAAIEEAVPAVILTASLFARFRSRKPHNFADQLLSAMRLGFGGHVEPKVEKA